MAICIVLVPLAVVLAARPAAERWDLAGSFLSREVSPQDQVWIYPSDSALPLSHVGRNPGHRPHASRSFSDARRQRPDPRRLAGDGIAHSRQAAQLAGDGALKKAPVVWLVTRQSGIFDPDNDLPTALGKLRNPGRIQSWGYISVQPFTLR